MKWRRNKKSVLEPHGNHMEEPHGTTWQLDLLNPQLENGLMLTIIDL